MKFKSVLNLEVEKNEKIFTIGFPVGATFQDCYDFLQEASKKIIELSKEAEEKEKKAKTEETDKSEKTEEKKKDNNKEKAKA